MARIQLLVCFTILLASVTLLDVVSAHLKLKPALPQIEDPKTVKDVEPYTVKVVMVFVSDLEKECPKTNKFKAYFEKLRAFAKYVCPIAKKDQKDYDRDMKAKAGSLFQAISSFAIGKIKEEIMEEKLEAVNTFKWMKSLAGKIMGARKKEESEESMKLTAEQQKEIKEGILKWETVIARITNTMLQSTGSSSASGGDSTSGKETSSGSGKSSGSGSSSSGKGSSSSGSGTSYKDTTGSSSDMGSSSGSPATSPSGSTDIASGGSGTSYADTTGVSSISPAGSPANSPAGSTTSNSQGSTVAEVEAETSKEVMQFIMNLEKKCPPKEEFKSFFEKLKGTMMASAKVTSEKKNDFFSGIKSAAGKVSDAMSFMGSRLGSKSSEVKKSMESYQGEVTKALHELDAIHKKILSQSQGKKDGTVTVTETQRTEIKQTITKWETVTTQFVETAMKSESTTNSPAGIDKIKLN
ncbi:hypothetical protein EUTSA_v10004155mg [Eutrema salsugineum]|uniref:DUF1216 domain-containing protein n=1 Tax=Eutrema salsugineum TaxID=72664 RepID=V4K4X6_EUTSA|nr:P17/29C-like protein DDB_G0287399 [Eutrema salsugineum]ESQ32575.1 hypothetical protein EUTSA_v10004155mg [Eutrema salsugineum]